MDYYIHKIPVGELQANCYLFVDVKSNKCAVIDPGAEPEKIKEVIERNNLTPLFIINTHGHADHILANEQLNLPVYISKYDADFFTDPNKNLSSLYGNFTFSKKPARLLDDNDKIDVEGLVLKVIHTPGHTPGGICLLHKGVLFSGDTLFASGIGRTDLPYGSEAQIINSIKNKLFTLPDETKVYSGHGPETTIGKERRNWI